MMAYNYPTYGYQPNYYPQTPQQNNIIWVQGEAGAKSYLVAPNTTVTLWDSESQTIYLKSADSVGMPSIRVLDYTIRNGQASTTEEYVTRDVFELLKNELDSLKARIEEMGE